MKKEMSKQDEENPNRLNNIAEVIASKRNDGLYFCIKKAIRTIQNIKVGDEFYVSIDRTKPYTIEFKRKEEKRDV